MNLESSHVEIARPATVHWCAGARCCDPLWEQAYQDFETPAEEIRKFLGRYRKLGVDGWPRDASVVDLFCGRGNSLVALARLGYLNLEGVDLSPDLLEQYQGGARTYVGDCRDLRFSDESKEVVVIQGGLHHLPDFPRDVEAVLAEARRVLRPGGRLVLIEPWLTPFLRIVHVACAVKLLRRAWGKLDAVARMNEREHETYFRWLGRPEEIRAILSQYFERRRQFIGWGKLMYVGEKPRNP